MRQRPDIGLGSAISDMIFEQRNPFDRRRGANQDWIRARYDPIRSVRGLFLLFQFCTLMGVTRGDDTGAPSPWL